MTMISLFGTFAELVKILMIMLINANTFQMWFKMAIKSLLKLKQNLNNFFKNLASNSNANVNNDFPMQFYLNRFIICF